MWKIKTSLRQQEPYKETKRNQQDSAGIHHIFYPRLADTQKAEKEKKQEEKEKEKLEKEKEKDKVKEMKEAKKEEKKTEKANKKMDQLKQKVTLSWSGPNPLISVRSRRHVRSAIKPKQRDLPIGN